MSKLIMTSPRIKDSDEVRAAQALLANNPYGEFYREDEPRFRDDRGTFGRWTAEACFDARYSLGFPKTGESAYKRRRWDDELESYLNGGVELPAAYKRRRAERKKAAQASPGKKALEFGIKTIGEKEVPDGSNRTQTTAYWGFLGAWCLMWVSRCYIETGSKVFDRGDDWAYNPTLYWYAKSGKDDRIMMVPLAKAEPGDIIQLDLNNGTEPPDHGCLYVKDNGDGTIRCLDGNWGDDVGYENHPKSQVMSVLRILG